LRKAALCPTAAATVVATLSLLAGCGDGSGNAPGADIPLQAAIQVSPLAVESVALTATETGDHFTVDGATAHIQRPSGSTDDVTLDLSSDGRTLTLGRATVEASIIGDAGLQAQADVRVVAEVSQGASGEIGGVTLRTRDTGDTLDVAGAKAYVERPDGSSDAVDMEISADGTEVKLGAFNLAPTPGTLWYWRLNRLVIEGPVHVQDGPTGSRTEIGSLAFSFGAYRGDKIVAPSTIRASIPTIGVALDRRVVVEGLTGGDGYTWAAITDNSGGVTYSKAYMADDTGQAIIPDTLGQFTAERLSGPDSHIEMCFGDTYKRTPPPILWPPIYDVKGPGDGGRPGLNVLAVDGPIGLYGGAMGATAELGKLRLAFEVLSDGTVVLPATISFSLPTRGVARSQSVEMTGLAAGDFVQTKLVDNSNRVVRSAIVQAAAGSDTTVADAQGGMLGSDLSGSGSSFTLFFARTDLDGDGKPDLF
jgi:hypothetical protein